MGRDSLKAMITLMHAKIKDQKMETIKDLADDEYVFSWIRYTGTSDGSLGMPAGPYDMTAMEVVKFKEGKAIEHWAFMVYLPGCFFWLRNGTIKGFRNPECSKMFNYMIRIKHIFLIIIPTKYKY